MIRRNKYLRISDDLKKGSVFFILTIILTRPMICLLYRIFTCIYRRFMVTVGNYSINHTWSIWEVRLEDLGMRYVVPSQGRVASRWHNWWASGRPKGFVMGIVSVFNLRSGSRFPVGWCGESSCLEWARAWLWYTIFFPDFHRTLT